MMLPISKNSLVVVAMSGGVDSATVAAILVKEGYNVVGITLRLYSDVELGKRKTCCAHKDIVDARVISAKLNIPHYVLDYEDKFKEGVIEDFIDSYNKGETPLPCVRCNQTVKFNGLLNVAKQLGASSLATGHYVRKILGKYGVELHSGVDSRKDQSYFLFSTTREQLEYLCCPLGNFTKEQTRELAKDFGLSIHDKPDSQDICFVPSGNYRKLISEIQQNADGRIVHVEGYDLGKHNGIANFTIGQRKGLGISYKEPLYVIKIDPISKVVYVGPESKLNFVEFSIKDTNWLVDNSVLSEVDTKVKIRSSHSGVIAKVRIINNNEALITLLSPEKAVAPGQACVVYSGTHVLGGGWIYKTVHS